MNDQSLYEKIPHVTKQVPVSYHDTHTPKGLRQALYAHWHTEGEFLYLTEGEMKLHIDNREYLLRAGEGAYIAPGLLHYGICEKNVECVYTAVVFQVVAPFQSDESYLYSKYVKLPLGNKQRFVEHFRRDLVEHEQILICLKRLLAYGTDVAENELSILGCLMEMWGILYQNRFDIMEEKNNEPEKEALLIPAMECIRTSYKNVITLEALAASCSLSTSYFCHLFKEIYGKSPMNYLICYRLGQSARLLVDTDLKITDIGYLSGFSNISYFNRQFLTTYGITPKEFRRNHKEL